MLGKFGFKNVVLFSTAYLFFQYFDITVPNTKYFFTIHKLYLSQFLTPPVHFPAHGNPQSTTFLP